MDSGKDSVWVGGVEVMPLKLWFKAGLTPMLEQVAQGCVHPTFENLQGQRLHNLCATC